MAYFQTENPEIEMHCDSLFMCITVTHLRVPSLTIHCSTFFYAYTVCTTS